MNKTEILNLLSSISFCLNSNVFSLTHSNCVPFENEGHHNTNGAYSNNRDQTKCLIITNDFSKFIFIITWHLQNLFYNTHSCQKYLLCDLGQLNSAKVFI